jgi:hypothetical protein
MNNDPTSLDRLHDVALPPDISWWPLAPGWYFIITLFVLTSLWLAWHFWSKWQANAYRREALRELASARDITSIAAILRCTALAIAPRELIVGKTSTDWLDWLDEQCPSPLPSSVRDHLTTSIYGRPAEPIDLTELREFAVHFISQHRKPPIIPTTIL